MGGKQENPTSEAKPDVGSEGLEAQKELLSQGSSAGDEKSRDGKSGLTFTPKGENGDTQVAIPDDPQDPFGHLPTHEAEVLRRQLNGPNAKISFIGLYRYATKIDILIIVVSSLCSIAAGAALPLFTVSPSEVMPS